MFKTTNCILCLLLIHLGLKAQSLELLPSTEYVFADIQWLKPFDRAYRFTLFSRTRMQVDYQEQVNFFSGAYFSYTQKNGWGTTFLGRANNTGVGADGGIHYNRNSANWSFFGLLAKDLTETGGYSWFSILRYRLRLNETWKAYSSLELFTAMDGGNHIASLQRIRFGLDRAGYQFGLGFNWLELGNGFLFINDTYGIFIRKEFK